MRIARMIVLAATTLIVLSCGDKGKTKDNKKEQKPARTGTDQRPRPDRPGPVALSEGLQGASKLLAAIPGAPQGQNTVKITDKSSSVVVNPLFFFTKPGGGAGGAMGKARIQVAPNATDEVSVGVFEQHAGGAGSQWRSAVFMASFLSCVTLGKMLTDFQFSVHCGGDIDGPSAGGLMSAGMLAAMTRAKVNPLATMTGIINPDGTIGPVGGIPQKFAAAAAKGKKILGYPVGQRISVDLATRQKVDLHQVAAQGQARAVEVTDIYDAYKLLTNKTIPRPSPVAANRMALSAGVSAALVKYTQQWLKHTQTAIATFKRTGVSEKSLTAFANRGLLYAGQAQKLLTAKAVSAAYERALESAVLATVATYGAAFVAKLGRNDLAGILAELSKLAKAGAALDRLADQLTKIEPKTVNEFMGLLFAYSYTVEAIATSYYGKQKYEEAQKLLAQIKGQGRPPTRQQLGVLVKSLFSPTIYLSVCYIMASAGTQMAQISSVGGGRPLTINAAKLGKMADMFRSAAMTNLRYFDSIILEPLSKQHNKSLNTVRGLLMDKKLPYMLATLSLKLGNVIREKLGNTVPGKMGLLAASVTSYLTTSMLVAKAYSLGVKEDANDEPVAIGAKKAFINMLRAGELRARETAASALAATGKIPVGAKASYLTARAYLTSQSLADQLNALQMLWTSSVVNQLAVMLVTL